MSDKKRKGLRISQIVPNAKEVVELTIHDDADNEFTVTFDATRVSKALIMKFDALEDQRKAEEEGEAIPAAEKLDTVDVISDMLLAVLVGWDLTDEKDDGTEYALPISRQTMQRLGYGLLNMIATHVFEAMSPPKPTGQTSDLPA